jgi:hypothetical protein
MSGHRKFQAPTSKLAFISRSQAVQGATRALQRFGWPRMQMFLIVAITGLSGFIASVLLFYSGVSDMAVRYPIAISVAYLFFLLQLWIWLYAGDTLDPNGLDSGGVHGEPGHGFEGGGGDFGGGGASGHWDAAAAIDGSSSGFDAVGDSLGSAVDVADGEGCVVVVVVAAIAILAGGLFLSAFYLVWGAPALMGELLVDAALSYGLYRNLRKQHREFWLLTALRRTAWLFLLVAVLASLVGMGLAKWAPGSRTLGEAMDYRRGGEKNL